MGKKKEEKKSYQKTFFLTGTLGRDRRLNFGAVLSNSCRQQRKVQKRIGKKNCRRRRVSSEQADEVRRGGQEELFSK